MPQAYIFVPLIIFQAKIISSPSNEMTKSIAGGIFNAQHCQMNTKRLLIFWLWCKFMRYKIGNVSGALFCNN